MKIKIKASSLDDAISLCNAPLLIKNGFGKYICVGLVESIDYEQGIYYANCTMTEQYAEYGIVKEEEWIISKRVDIPIFEHQGSEESNDCTLVLLKKLDQV